MDRPERENEDIGVRLKQVRLLNHLSASEFAGQLGVTQAIYRSYEAGSRDIPASLMVKLLHHWHIDPTWLLTGRKQGTSAQYSAALTRAYRAIIEAAKCADLTLDPDVFGYALSAALPTVLRGEDVNTGHAAILIKLATINARK